MSSPANTFGPCVRKTTAVIPWDTTVVARPAHKFSPQSAIIHKLTGLKDGIHGMSSPWSKTGTTFRGFVPATVNGVFSFMKGRFHRAEEQMT